MSESLIDYSNLINPSTTNKNRDLSINVIPSKPKFKFAKDIFEFIENPEFIGEDLFPMQREVLETYYNTKDHTDTRIFQELVIISGMRSGKTKLAGMIGSYELHKLLEILESGQTFKEYFKPRGVEIGIGQQIYIVTIAAALDQAETTVFSALKAYLLHGPWFMRYNNYLKNQGELKMGKFEITYKDLIRIKAEDSNSQTLVGKTIHTLLFDEISRLDTSDAEIGKKSEKRNAEIVYQSISKGTLSFRRDRNIIVVSAPVYEDDFGMGLLMRSGTLNVCEETSDIINTMAQKFPKKVRSRLGYHSTSFAFNTSIDRDNDPLIEGIRETSPLAYRRDVLALPPAGINAYFEDAKKIDACLTEYKEIMVQEHNYHFDEVVTDGNGYNLTRTYVGKSPVEIKSNNLIRYFISCDQAAKKDSFALAIGHGEWVQVYDEKTGEMKKKLKTVIDYVTCWKPDRDKNIEVSFENVIQFIVTLKEYINIQTITFDQWNSTTLFQAMHKFGIQTKEISTGAGTAIWESLKSKINNGLVAFPTEEQCIHVTLLLSELKKLQLIKGKTIDHPVHGCFVGETRIPIVNGTPKMISELVGQTVDVYSAKPDGTMVPGIATGRLTKYVTSLLDVTLSSGDIIRCTPEHLFMLKNGTYTPANTLRPEVDELMTVNLLWTVSTDEAKSFSPHMVVKSITPVELVEPVPVYDLEVDKWDNFALQAGIVVHNSKDLGDAVARINYLVEEAAQGIYTSMNPIEKDKLLKSIGGDDNIRTIVMNNILPLMEKRAESVTGGGGFFFTSGNW